MVDIITCFRLDVGRICTPNWRWRWINLTKKKFLLHVGRRHRHCVDISEFFPTQILREINLDDFDNFRLISRKICVAKNPHCVRQCEVSYLRNWFFANIAYLFYEIFLNFYLFLIFQACFNCQKMAQPPI